MKNHKTFRTLLRLALFLSVFGTIAWTQSGLLSINPNFLSSGFVGEAYPNTQFTQCCSTQPVTWSISAGTPPPGLNINSAGLFTGTPTAAGVYNFTVRVSENVSTFLDQPITLWIYERPQITNASPLPDGEIDIPYSLQLNASGGESPYYFTEVIGEITQLPPGLFLNSETGEIYGTPTGTGTFTFTIRVMDSNEVSSTKQFNLTILPSPSITTEWLDYGMTYNPYLQTLTAGGGKAPYTWSITEGPLPPGLVLNPATGVISGTPTATGYFPLIVRVQDSLGGSATVEYLYIYVQQGLAVLTSSLQDGIINQPYSQTLIASPYDYNSMPNYGLRGGARLRSMARTAVVTQAAESVLIWEVYYGSLPPGLTLDPATGVISGTPTEKGIFPFSVIVRTNPALDIYQVVSMPKNLVIGITDPPVDFTPSILEPGFAGIPYTVTFTGTGGDGKYTFALAGGAVPPGLEFNAETHTLSGTPTTVGTYYFVVNVTSGKQTTGRNLRLVIEPAQLTLLPLELPEGYQGTAYSAHLTAQLGTAPYTFSVASGALPDGVNLAPDGAISGTPTTAGTYSVTLKVTDADSKTATRDYTVQIYGVLTLGPNSLPSVEVGQSYSTAMVATGGKAPLTYSIAAGILPPGLQLVASGGSILGTPTQQGEFQFTGRVTDANGKTADHVFVINVTGPLQLQPTSLPVAPLNLSYTPVVTASGGTAPYSYSVTGMLPPGVTFSSSGAFGGAPMTPGDYPVRVAALDSQGRSISRAYVISVPRGLAVTPESISSMTAGSDVTVNFQAGGGTAPYQWASDGTLPTGLTLNSGTGVLSGKPATAGTFNFTVRAQDSVGVTGSRSYSVQVTLPPLPTLTITELPESSPPGQQPRFGIQLSAPYPLPITGTMNLTFAPDSGPDDPAVQFANGGRTTTYSIPAGTASGVFVGTPAIQTGTVAGLITLVTRYTAGGQDVTPTPAPTDTIRVNATAPVLTRIELTRTTGAFEVILTGYSSTRQVNSAIIRFTAAPGENVQTPELTVPLSGLFQTWYANSASAPYGSQFRLVIPFSVYGVSNAVASVSAQLTNSVGASNTITGNFQ